MERIKGKLKKSKVIDLSVSFSQSPKFKTKRCLLLNCKKKYETRHNINHHKINPLCEWKPKKLKVTKDLSVITPKPPEYVAPTDVLFYLAFAQLPEHLFKRHKINPKEIPKKYLHWVKPSTRQQCEEEHKKHIQTQINRGFTPKWYIVFHLNDWLNDIPKDDPIWDKYQGRLKNAVWTAIYGSHWQRVKTKARGIFSLEFGKDKDRPHINLLIEDLPKHLDVDYLFNWSIPVLANKKVNFVWEDSAKVKPYYSDSVTGYISKEMNYEYTSSINYQISDYIP